MQLTFAIRLSLRFWRSFGLPLILQPVNVCWSVIDCVILFFFAVPQMWTVFCHFGDTKSPSPPRCCGRFFDVIIGSSSNWSWLVSNLLSPCVQRAGISAFHLVFLSLYIILSLYQTLVRNPRRQTFKHGVDVYFRVLQSCCIYLCSIHFGVLLFWIADGYEYNWSGFPVDIVVATGVQSVAWGVMYMATEDTRKQRRPFFSSFLRAWWIMAFLFSTFTFVSSVLVNGQPLWVIIVEVGLYPAVLFVAYLGCRGRTGIEVISDDEMEEHLLNGASDGSTGDQHERVELYENAGFLSLLTLSWLSGILRVGRRKPLELEDMPPLPPEDSTEAMYELFKSSWDALKQKKPDETPSVVMALWISFKPYILVNAVFAFINVVASYVGPFLINDFVEYLNGRRRFEHEGLALVLVFSIAKVIENATQRQWYYGIQFICLRVKAALTVVVYRKAMRLSNTARQSHSSGEIINYMSVDVQRISDCGWYIHQVWILPLEVALALGILYRVVGMAWVAGLVAAAFTLLLNTPLEQMQEKYQAGVMEAKDKRMKSLSECLRNMRVLKLQAWEQRFLKKIEELRQGEYHWLFKDCIARALGVFAFWLTPVTISVATFGACVLFGIPLTSGRILSAIATFRVMQDAISSFPELVSFYAQTKVWQLHLMSSATSALFFSP